MGVKNYNDNVEVLSYLTSTPGAGICCQKKTVTDIANDLNGVYTFKRGGGDSEDQDCYNGCVYKKEGAPDSNEYCFKSVTQGAATIADEECEAVSSSTGPTGPSSTGPTGPSSTGPTGPSSTGPTGPSSTAGNPVETIKSANEAIEKANADHAEATKNANTANDAGSAVDDIQAKLSSASSSTTAGVRIKRQASSTVGPITTCDDFTNKYTQLLDELIKLSDDNIGLIQQLAAALTGVLNAIPCTPQKQAELNEASKSKVVTAKAKTVTYIEVKEEEKKAAGEKVQAALQQIADANAQLVSSGSTTIPPVTASFTVQQTTGGSSGPQTSPAGSSGPQTSPAGSSGPQTSPGGSSGPQTSPGASSGPQTSPGGSSGPQTSPGGSSEPQTSPGASSGPQTSPGGSSEPQTSPEGSSQPQTSPGGSSTPTMTTTVPNGRRLNKFRIFN